MTLEEGERFEVLVGEVAHGGHCVARLPADASGPGIVIFVRHALPGEKVIAEVTEVHKGYARAEAVEIIEASPERREAPCRYAHAFGCGGCDLQHVTPAAQLGWKTAVVREQLSRLGGVPPRELEELDVRVVALPDVPGEAEGLGWRTRVRYSIDAADRAGLRKHRSHEVVAIDECLIAHPAIRALPVLDRLWPSGDDVHTVAPSGGPAMIMTDPSVRVTEHTLRRDFDIAAGGFWQVHPAAATTLAETVLDMLKPQPGETAWDLYGGAGLFAAVLGDAVGVTGHVTLVDSAPDLIASARINLGDLPVRVIDSTVERVLTPKRSSKKSRGGGGSAMPLRSGSALLGGPIDLVVLDPPRTGAGAAVVKAIVAAAPRAVAYVACDPAALGRDVATFREAGWRLVECRAYDCFPNTHHVECVALLMPR
ncbi:tRNA/tmRNA/rRNA uracil-C5-methylase (TrmA/RlmC/RlmD family) [Allocatelliglobosispora scoriae]|uniref:tRNA/tmRNA/rRNA uracil-C5-methylase (TrmA/RlmC/RlmD family) n=1 Tax=Allocatelliglobosispora scoriae TaxID=643052 RepID=A0A841C0D4_9ACTN|nr:TRAM domain-containing protein [Allocatelliglobosispora scoriae]MBB5872410.1 tRNA/tmRNA/rRNA uracil-C5-methylase (TrmA/RlmC/RlmD family) [Allocatelliglobosispora scoriae]